MRRYITNWKIRPIEYSKVYFLLIVLFCVNLFARGSIVCLIFGLFALTKMPRKISLDVCTAWVVLLSISSALTSYMYSGIMEAIKCINFAFMYLAGLNGYHAARNKERYIKNLLFAVFLGYALLVCLTFFKNVTDGYEKGMRILVNFWTGERISATLIGLVSSVVIGYSFYALFCQVGRKLKIFVLFALVIVFLVNERSATRTPFLLFAVVMMIMWVIRLNYLGRNRTIKAIGVMLVLIVLILLLFHFDAFGIKTHIESTAIFARFLEEGTNTPRTETFRKHLRYMLDYPWGGGRIEQRTGEMAHNYLQQGHDLYGILATISLVMISVSWGKNIFFLIRRKEKHDVDFLLLAMYLAMIIQSMLEPVFTGYPCYMFSLLLMHGAANGYMRTRK